MFAEHFGNITGSGIRTGDIDHSLVHAHIAHHRTPFAAHIHLAAVVRETAVKTVRIADRNDGDDTVFGQFGMPSVTDRLAGFDGLDGQDSGLQA